MLRFIILVVGLAGMGNAGAVSPLEIQTRVEAFAAQAVAERYPNGEFTVAALPLAATVADRTCTDLQLNAPPHRLYGRVSVHVRCNAPETWALYAQVQIDVAMPVIVATEAIPRGTRLQASMLTEELRPLQQIRNQAVTNIADARGKAARVSVRSGQVLTINHLATPDAVRKGERVTITSGGGRVQIQTYGIALSNGKMGEQIEVRNTASKRIIYPWVVGPGQVSTRPAAELALVGG